MESENDSPALDARLVGTGSKSPDIARDTACVK
jgi:hypothetical protein